MITITNGAWDAVGKNHVSNDIDETVQITLALKQLNLNASLSSHTQCEGKGVAGANDL